MNKITISWLLKTIRPFTNNPNEAYQFMLDDLFSSLPGKDTPIRSTTSSRIMNGEYDVPASVREKAGKLKDEEIIENLNKYYRKSILLSRKDELFKHLKNLIAISDLSNDFKGCISEIDNVYILLSFLTDEAIKTDNREKLNDIIYDRGNFKLKVISGDLIALSLNKKEAISFKISVIPVDSKFTMSLSSKGDSAPLIAKDSLHGKFIVRLNKGGRSQSKLNSKIVFIETDNGLKIGKTTIKKTEFWLVPISTLDKRNRAISSIDDINKAIDAILDEYDVSGQGESIYIPLLGTGRARVFQNYLESLNFLKTKIIERAGRLNGEITIVVYKKDYANKNIKGENINGISN